MRELRQVTYSDAQFRPFYPKHHTISQTPMLGFKSIGAARCPIAGSEVRHAIRKGQLATTEAMSQTPTEQFSALAV
jgi:hypothetical protein